MVPSHTITSYNSWGKNKIFICDAMWQRICPYGRVHSNQTDNATEFSRHHRGTALRRLQGKKIVDSNEAKISPHVFSVANVIASPHRASVKCKLPQEFVIFITNLASLVYVSADN